MSTKSLRNNNLGKNTVANTQTPSPPVITSYTISGLDDTALDPAGGQTILINGKNFLRGATVTLNGTAIGVVSWVNANQLSFTSPVNTAGTYQLFVVNVDGGTAIYLPGIVYSSFPTWTTPQATLGSGYETTSFSSTVVATGDAPVTYSLYSGTLPSGVTISSSGVVSGTLPVDSGSTTYQFTVQADDAQNQSSTRQFSITVNTDVVTWVTPSSGATINLDGTAYTQSLNGTDAAGYAVSYTANALPTGLTLSSGTISGTPTSEGTTTTLLTATAATTNRTATNTITWVVSLNDAFWKYSTLLLTANSSSQPISFITDSSINNNQITVLGDTRASNFNPYQSDYYSIQFSATPDYFLLPVSTQLAFSGDYTIECWVYLNSVTGNQGVYSSIDNAADSWQGPYLGFNGTSFLATSYIGTTDTITHQTAVTNGKWYHIAMVRNGSITKSYLNGVQSTSTTTSTYSLTQSGSSIGTAYPGSGPLNGYISNLRIVKGSAIYTASFTPPTSPLLPINGTVLLVGQSNKLQDQSLNNFTLTATGSPKVSSAHPFSAAYQASTQYYSTKFDGTGDYLSIANNTAFTLGTNDHTIEFWIYLNGAQGAYATPWKYSSGSTQQATNDYYFYAGSAGGASFGLLLGGGGSWAVNISNNASYTAGLNTWTHVAITRSSNTFRLFVNGTQVGSSVSYSGSISAQSASMLIGQDGSSNFITGNISNFRLINGTALYTSNFTPSTTPLTAVANTVLLTCQDSTFKDNSTNNFAITGYGDAKPITISPFTPNYFSNYFNGSTDYLTTATNSAFDFGTGDFTIECWINPSAIASNRVFVSTQSNSSAAAGWSLFLFSSGYLGLDVMEGSEKYVTCSTTQLTVGNWYHVAYTRQSGTLRIFVNGVSQTFSGTQATNINSVTGLTIGRQQQAGYEYSFSGYISNVRVVKGTSLYNSAFTPSTSPLTAVANTSALTCQSLYFIDTSTNAFTITKNGTPSITSAVPFTQPSGYSASLIPTTYGSGYFDGTGDYLTVPVTQGLGFGTNNFTWECWLYPTSTASYFTIYDTSAGGDTSGTGRILIDHQAGGYLRVYTGAGTVQLLISPAAAIKANQWNHLAVTRSGTTGYLFVNGAMLNTNTVSTDFKAVTASGTNRPIIFANGYDASTAFVGYMTDMRVINGTCLYNSSFAPNISPLTNVPKTQLLISQTNGSHNNSTFKDSSSFNNVITRTGNVTNGTFSPYGDNWSNYFDGTGDYLTIANNTAFDFGTGDYTIECWINPKTLSAGGGGSSDSNVIASTYPSTGGITSWFFGYNTSGSVYAGSWLSGTVQTVATPNVITVGKWSHVAFTRTSGVNRIFVDGVSQTLSGTFTQAANSGGNALHIGAMLYDAYYNYPTAHFSNFRIVKGSSLYTSNFTPITTPLLPVANTVLLTCQSNRLIDSSVNNFTITRAGDVSVQRFSPFGSVTVPKYYSAYFDGSGDYLSIPQSTSMDLGTGDFTVESWIYPTASSASNRRIISKQDTSTSPQWILGLTNVNVVYFSVSSSSSYTGNTTISLNTWYHIAVVYNRSTTTLKIYVNGTQDFSTTYNGTPDTISYATYIGAYSGGSEYFTGYISNVRFVKGTAIIPPAGGPTSPLTAVTNTQLLMCQSATLVDNSSNYATVTVGGDTKPKLLNPFASAISSTPVNYNTTTFGGSMYFDGTGDYLTRSNINLGLANFTIEGWFYPTVLDVARNFWGMDNGGGANPKMLMYVDSSSRLTVDFGSAGTTQFPIAASISTYGLLVNQWNHVAVVRSDLTATGFKMFINGALVGTGQLGTNLNTITANFNLGYIGEAYGSPFSGYISDFRVIQGVALYTSSFVPSATPALPNLTLGASTYHSTLLLNGTSGSIIDATRTTDLETIGDSRVTNFSPYNGNYYSTYFDGTGDFLSVPYSSQLAEWYNTDYTMEAWVYTANWAVSVNNSSPIAISHGIVNNTTLYWSFGWNSTGYLGFYYWNGAASNLTSTTIVSQNTWHHIAMTHTNATGVISLYLDGVLVASGAKSGTPQSNSGSTIQIGHAQSTSFNGYISNVRITKGSLVYTSAFTPTAPLTAISNTQLLTCQSNKFVDNSSNNFTITRNGDTKVATQNPFQVNTGLSYYFDGTGDYLSASTGTSGDFGTGDFTIEFWMNNSSSGTYTPVVGTQAIAGNTTAGMWRVSVTLNSVKGIYFNYSTGSSFVDLTFSTTNYNDNSWHHVAAVRTSGSLKMYVDGVQVGTAQTVTQSLTSGQKIFVGYQPQDGIYYTGYVTDLRITKGYARTITVPIQPVKTN